MARSLTNWITFKSFNIHNQIKKEPSLTIERSNSCIKCGNPFTKGKLKVCPAKDITVKTVINKGFFAKLGESRNKRPTVNTVNDNYVILKIVHTSLRKARGAKTKNRVT